MTEHEKYMIYRRMFENCDVIAERVRHALESINAHIYTLDIFVGLEETREYECYFEFNSGAYKNIRGMFTEGEIDELIDSIISGFRR